MRRIVAVGLLWAWVVLGVVGGEGLVVEITTEGQLKEAIDPDYALAAVYVYDGKQKDASLSAKFQEVAKSLEGNVISRTTHRFSDVLHGRVRRRQEVESERELLRRGKQHRAPAPDDQSATGHPDQPIHEQAHADTTSEAQQFESPANVAGYQLGNMTAEQTVNMLVGMLPDYTSRLETGNVEQLQVAKFVNKVLLFTAKAQAPALFKALAAKYKNKLLVGHLLTGVVRVRGKQGTRPLQRIQRHQVPAYHRGTVHKPHIRGDLRPSANAGLQRRYQDRTDRRLHQALRAQ
jgi:hypothetical protein